ncbi:MAG: peptide deformylase [Gemmatimonadales bacterium]
MSLLPLHLYGSPVLRQQSAEVKAVDDEVREFVSDLFETMHASKGIGLAANQVGVPQRVAVVEVEGDRVVLINPEILQTEGRESAEEGCLSVPDVYADVSRPGGIVVEATDEQGNRYRREVSGLLARAIQHEIDHLDGILFLDHLGALKRRMLITRYRKEHRDDPGYIKEIEKAPTPTD